MEEIKNSVFDTPNPTASEPVQPGQETLVINQIQIRSVDHTRKDIGDWKNSWISADSPLMPNRTRLYDIYKTKVEIDGHLSGVVGKRTDMVLNKAIHYEDKGGKRVDLMDDLCNSLKFRDMRRNVLHTQYWGITGMEFIPGKEFDFKDIERKHIKPKWGIISTEQSGYDGFSYIGVDNLWVLGKPNDLGLFLKCAPYAILKQGNLADWGQFVEIFGQPIRVIKYDAYDRQAKVELREIIDEAGSSLALLIPKTADFELMDGKTSNANGDLQKQFHDTLNDEMDVCVLGNTETTGNSNGGSNAKAKTQHKDQMEVIKSDIDYLLGHLNTPQFMRILKSYGFPVSEGGKFVVEEELDLGKVQQQVNIAVTMKKNGVPVADDYFYEVTGIPKPANYNELKTAAQQQQSDTTAAGKDKGQGKKAASKKGAGKDDPPDLVDSIWNKFRIKLADFFAPAPFD